MSFRVVEPGHPSYEPPPATSRGSADNAAIRSTMRVMDIGGSIYLATFQQLCAARMFAVKLRSEGKAFTIRKRKAHEERDGRPGWRCWRCPPHYLKRRTRSRTSRAS